MKKIGVLIITIILNAVCLSSCLSSGKEKDNDKQVIDTDNEIGIVDVGE